MSKVIGALLGAAMMWPASPAWAEGSQQFAAETEDSARRVDQPAPALPRLTRDRNAGARLGFIVGGGAALAVFYGLPCAGEGGLWCVPFAGPVLLVAKRERRQSGSADEGEDGIVPPAFIYGLAGGLGMLQLTAAALLTAGVLMPRREVPVASASVTLLPLLGTTTAGLAATGTW